MSHMVYSSSSQVASMRGVSRPVHKLPASSQAPNIMLSRDLVSPSDIKFVSLQKEWQCCNDPVNCHV